MQPMKVDIPAIQAQERQLVNSKSSDLTPDPITAGLLDSYEKQIVWRPQGGGSVEANKIPDASERATLERRLSVLKSTMRPAALAMADRERVGAAVAAMFAGYPSQRNSDARATIATYVMELGGKPAWAVENACSAVRCGLVRELNPDFPPSAARLNQLADLELSSVKTERGKIEALLSVVLSPSKRSQAEQDKAAESAKAWLERKDQRAAELTAAGRVDADEASRERTLANAKEFFERECRAEGIDPSRGVSPSLLKTLGVK
jgi:hypothetical protein